MTGGRLRHDWLVDLLPEGEIDLVGAASPTVTVADAVERVGAGPVRWALEVNLAVVARVVAEVPALGGDPAAVELLRRGNEATTLQALCTLLDASGPPLAASGATLDGVREFVRSSVALDDVLRGVRAGHAATTEAFLAACARRVDPPAVVEELTSLSRDLFAFVDGLSDAMVRAYLAEHEVWSTSAAAVRADVVRALLAGDEPDAATRSLGYDLGRTHRAVVVWSDSPDAGQALHRAATEVLRARGATATLVVPVSSARSWAWGAVVPDPLDPSWTPVEDILDRHGVQAAFGDPGHGVPGFRRSHQEAVRGEELERVRRDAGQAPRLATIHDEIATVALLASDLDAARTFVLRELGGLAARTESVAALRRTLYHYLDAERSLVDVARRLYVARGTVTYRVRRAQEILGRSLDDRRFELHCALRLTEDLGDAVLLPVDGAP